MVIINLKDKVTRFLTVEADWITFREQCIALVQKYHITLSEAANVLKEAYLEAKVKCIRLDTYVDRINRGIMEIRIND